MIYTIHQKYSYTSFMPQDYIPSTTHQRIWIDSDKMLAQYCLSVISLPEIVLDTEFIRTSTYYPKPGLIQMATTSEIFLIDPLSINNWKPFADIMTSKVITKIFHSCREDLETLKVLMDIPFNNIADTQHAAAYAGIGYSKSYLALVNKLTGITLDKGERCSNWLQRPLKEKQLIYATQDVLYLLPIYHKLLETLKANGYLDWYLEDSKAFNKPTLNIHNAWKKVKKASQLNAKQLLALKKLYYFRENQAQDRDIPRNHVLHPASLWHLARYQPNNHSQLARTPQISPAVIGKYGETILEIIRKSAEEDCEVSDFIPLPLPKSMRHYTDKAKTYIQNSAQQLQLPHELLLSNKILQKILKSWVQHHEFKLPDTLQGWRRETIGEPLTEYLNQQLLENKTTLIT